MINKISILIFKIPPKKRTLNVLLLTHKAKNLRSTLPFSLVLPVYNYVYLTTEFDVLFLSPPTPPIFIRATASRSGFMTFPYFPL